MRTLSFEKGIGQVADMLRATSERTNKATAFLGAGVSIAAGIPGAYGLIEEVRDTYRTKFGQLPADDQRHYGKVMHALAPADRRQLIRRVIDQSRMNWANIALAQLVAKGYFSRVLTVNFDPLLTEACRLVGCSPAVYDFGVAPVTNVGAMATPAIVHLHGQSTGVVLLNTHEETERHAIQIVPLLDHCLPNAPLVVVGYSGKADALLQRISNSCSGDHDVYWLDIFDEPPDHVAMAFKGKDYVHYVARGYADRFFVEVAQKLACFPPEFIRDPLGHLMSEAKRIVEFPRGSESETQDLLALWRNDVSELQKIDQERFSLRRQVVNSSLAGDDKAAKEAARASPADTQLSAVVDGVSYWGFIKAGNAAQEKGRNATMQERDNHYSSAASAYRQALEVRPNGYEALNNLGNVIGNMASATSDPTTREQLFDEACQKYAAAVKIKPDMHEAYSNWGATINDIANRTVDEKMKVFHFSEACKKFEAAVSFKSDMHEAYFNWGIALREIAVRAADPNYKDRLLADAAEKYATALSIKPDKLKALVNWGNVLIDQAERAEDTATRMKLLAASAEKYHASERLSKGSATYNLACNSALAGRAIECRDYLLAANVLGDLPDRKHIEEDPDLASVRTQPWWPEILALATNSASGI